MWIPQTVEDLHAAISQRLHESPVLDAKRELGSTKDLARHIAAMATDGGVLLYGVDEDGNGRLSEITPVDLADAEERISNVVRTGIHGTPRTHPISLEHQPGSGEGVLVLVVPKSPLAPHMVELGGDNRFYCRRGTQTHRMSGNEVDDLHAQRRQSREDARSILSDARHWTLHENSKVAGSSMTLVVKPSVPVGRPIERAAQSGDPRRMLQEVFGQAIDTHQFRGDRYDHPLNEAVLAWRIAADFHIASHTSDDPLYGTLEVQVQHDGTLVHRNADIGTHPMPVNVRGGPDEYLREALAAQHAMWMFAAAGEIFRRAEIVTPVLVGVHIAGTLGTTSVNMKAARERGLLSHLVELPEVLDTEYVRTDEVLSLDLEQNPYEVAGLLFEDLFRAATGGSKYPEGWHPTSLAD